MNNILLGTIGLLSFMSSIAHAKTTLYQCAVDRVGSRGARVNLIENEGVIRANLIFGSTVSGTIYNVHETRDGYEGQIKNKPDFSLGLVITKKRAKNSNIEGYQSHLKANYPTVLNSRGYDIIEISLVCGEKISDTWN